MFEDRLELAIARDCQRKGSLLWHTIVFSRIRKIIQNPISFLKIQPQDEDDEIKEFSTNMRTNCDVARLVAIKRRCRQLEVNFAKEVQTIWRQFGTTAPESPYSLTGGPYVHARVVDQPLQISSLRFPHESSTDFSQLMELVQRSTKPAPEASRNGRVSSSSFRSSSRAIVTPARGFSSTSRDSFFQETTTRTRSTNALSSNDLALDTTLTLPYNIIRKPLHDRQMVLLG